MLYRKKENNYRVHVMMSLMSCSFMHSQAIPSVVPSEKTSRPVDHHQVALTM
jgi:hypothetical protein